MSKQATLAAVLLALIATLAWSVTAEAAPNAKSAATITASFGASCTDFEAHSSKDISHVEVHYTDDRVVKNEDIAGVYTLKEGKATHIKSFQTKVDALEAVGLTE